MPVGAASAIRPAPQEKAGQSSLTGTGDRLIRDNPGALNYVTDPTLSVTATFLHTLFAVFSNK